MRFFTKGRAIGAILFSTTLASWAADHSAWVNAMLEARKTSTKPAKGVIDSPKWRTDNNALRNHSWNLHQKFPVEMAWLFQDGEFERRDIYQTGKVKNRQQSPEMYDFVFNYLDSSRTTPDYEKQLVRNALDDLSPKNAEFEKTYADLVAKNLPATDAAWLTLYSEICDARRAERMKLYGEKGPRHIAFVTRNFGKDGHWYANFGYRIDDEDYLICGNGGYLAVLDTLTGKETRLLEEKTGSFRDPVVHFDGKKIMFSWRKDGAPNYLLYEINIDGTGLRQVTHGEFDDIESIYLPDGDIMFVSSRAKRWVNCWQTQVATIHRSDANGKNIKRLSANIEHDNSPWLLEDGRIAYMRWEYVDRSQSAFHHLWVMNPDGTQQQALFGNMHPRNLYIDAKPIPGTKEIVFSSQDGHGGGEHRGAVATYKIDQGPDVQTDMKIWSLSDYEDPFPVIDENWFIAARDKNIVLMSRDGALEILYSTAGISAREPRPIMPSKRPPVIADRTDWTQKTGRLMLSDVHIGRKMANVKKGEIKQLLVMETVPKPVNWGGGVLDMTSVSYAGSFTLERVLGTVPVEPDGSANFEVPANQPLILAAIDENGSLVKRMHSFVSVMPGETLSCIGCHEDRTMVTPPMTKLPAAYTRAPDTIKPLDGIPEIFDYNRDIQPIWDKHCVSCHNNEKPSGMVNLTRDRGITYTQSYMNLRARKEFFLGNNQHGNYEPRTVGDSASPLMKRLSGEHHGVKLSPLEFQKVQTWINAGGGTYTSTYSALGTGHLFPNMLHHDILKFKFDFPEIKAGHASLAKNCATCHTKEKEVNKIEEFEGNHMLWPRFGRKQRPFAPAEYIQHALYNFTDIEESRVLKIGLAKDAGGFATNPAGTRKVERDENGVWKHPVVFKDKNEQGYKDLQAYIQAFKNFLDKNPQYDSPDFIPNEAYVREMKRFGIMPADYDPTTRTLDFGKLEKIYFDETWKDAWPEEIRASVFEK